MEELNCRVAFTIPLFGGIPIYDSVAVTWVIMAALVLLSKILVRNLRVEDPGKAQLFLESSIGFLRDFFLDLVGEEGKNYIPYLISTAVFIGAANLIGIVGFVPPTKDLNMTAALAVISIAVIEYAGFHKKGARGFLKSFAEPVAVILPINILEIFIRPISLCMRLFGNVLGSFVVMELIKLVVPVIIPIPFSFYFDIFDGVIQAYVFVFLTALFIKEQLD
ncbi:MAG: F0F1 ATP synthase subunit A [Clostridium sp.]|nr:F0F1 ATP synthase subunit A [Clostridiaceae bacterium Marseille-Q3526]MBS6263771.1 F0F1 ATP synthase subunit A [Clostridium sp.]MBS6375530.1 F0F1 ATP synthase subunit A [Clostridium sp.]MBS6518282.1 F0F1 ATP synthase subunit A [Clostridium sp.]MBS6914403.1 F0F1 ATP synthase subunit A [Clostridium sp.]